MSAYSVLNYNLFYYQQFIQGPRSRPVLIWNFCIHSKVQNIDLYRYYLYCLFNICEWLSMGRYVVIHFILQIVCFIVCYSSSKPFFPNYVGVGFKAYDTAEIHFFYFERLPLIRLHNPSIRQFKSSVKRSIH